MLNKRLLSTLMLGAFTFALVMISCDSSGPGSPNLEIIDVSPEQGAIGTEITITGSGFVPKASDNNVTFNGTSAEVISVTPDSLVVRVPVGATSGPIEIEIDDKSVTGPSFIITSGEEGLAVSSIDPTEGPVGTEVTITGCNFSPNLEDNTVTFNGTSADVISVNGASKAVPNQSETDSSDTQSGKNKGVTSSDSLSSNTSEPSTNSCGNELVAVVPDGATTGPVEVEVDGQSATGPEFTVTEDGDGEVPSIDGITPTEGPIGTEVTITGENFAPDAGNNTVKFGDVEANVTNASETELTAVVPDELESGDVVPVSVTVDEQTGVGPEFTVTEDGGAGDAPSVGDINPTEGPTGTEVTITGENFAPNPDDNTVQFGDHEGNITEASENELVVIVPDELEPGDEVTVSVTVDGQTGEGPTFTVTEDGGGGDVPSIGDIDPTEGPTGTEVTITGENFAPNADDNTVQFGDAEATVSSASETELTAIVPDELEPGDEVTVSVTVDGQTAEGPAFTVTDDGSGGDAPSVGDIDPTEGPTGTEVTITGENFGTNPSDNTVTFNGTEAEINSASETELVVIVPDDATTGPVAVTVDGQTATGPEFTVTEDGGGGDAPSVGDIDPTEGPTGTEVTITGENFAPNADDNTVQFGDAEATVSSASETELTAIVPDELEPGDEVTVSVTVDGETAEGPAFTVTDDGSGGDAPSVGDIDPTEGPTGTEVTITGENFGTNPSDNTVTFNGTEAEINSASETELVVIVPDDATTGPVAVTVDGQTATGPEFTVTEDGGGGDAPSIGDIDPTEGPTGTEVTITGENFAPNAGDNTVEFGGSGATVNSATETEIVAVVPDDLSPGETVDVTVMVDGQTATSPDQFTVTNDGSGAPVIDGIDPVEGEVGIVVTITGENFASAASDNTVEFGGSTATINSATETEIQAVVPDGLGAGAVDVTVTVGGETAISPDQFTVTVPAPVVDDIDPTSGTVGTEVTITGENFASVASENTVEFGTEGAMVTSASETELIAEVPGSLSGGDVVTVSVTVEGQTADGPDFTVLEEGEPQFPIIGSNASIDHGTAGGCAGCGMTNEGNVIDSNTDTNFGQVEVSLGVAGGYYVSVESAGNIPSGGDAGYVVVNQGDLIGADLLDQITLTTYLDGAEQESASGSTLLNLELLSGSSDKQFISFQTSNEFDEIEIEFGGLLSASATYEVYAAYGGQEAEPVPGPAINSVSPERGPEGTEVTITGENFSSTDSENTVTFDGVEATITSATETELVVEVPAGATTGPLDVLVAGQTATYSDFIVGAVPLTGSDLSVDENTTLTCLGCSVNNEQSVIDEDQDNFASVEIPVSVAGTASIIVSNTETMPSGGQAGFVLSRSSGALDAGLLENITIETFLNGSSQETFPATSLLLVDLLSGSSTERKFVGVDGVTTEDFDTIEIRFSQVVGADITYEVYSVFDDYFVTD